MARSRQQGFSLVELVVALAVIFVLVAGSYWRYMDLVVDAERAAFKGVWGWMRAGINMEMSHALGSEGFESLAALEQSNPMALVMKVMDPPSNYLGELSEQQAKRAEPGHWYYDLDQRLLIYRVRYTENLVGISDSSDNRLKFKLKVIHRSADSKDNKGNARVSGLQLKPMDKDFWKTPLSFGKKPAAAG
ncbi:MAG: prepilin-type N-terminal cleavage/methylation domain-containing protein [Motiliproteus sp.]